MQRHAARLTFEPAAAAQDAKELLVGMAVTGGNMPGFDMDLPHGGAGAGQGIGRRAGRVPLGDGYGFPGVSGYRCAERK